MLFLLMLMTNGWSFGQSGHLPDKDRYLGQPRPGELPRLFDAGRVSDGMSNRDMAISPAGDELFYTIQGIRGQVSAILTMHFVSGAWSGPEMAPFAGKYSDLEAAFSSDGQTLYFVSNRPADPNGAVKDYDIFTVKKEKGRWGTPVRLDTAVNSAKDEFYPSPARSGNLYFTREMENGKGKEDIVVSEWKNGRYQPPYSLPAAINSDQYEFNAFVDPDEKYLLFTSFGRKDDLGGGDLYLSYKNKEGEWMPAVHLDSTINSKAIDFCPFVSPDGKYFFFTSSRIKDRSPSAPPLDLKTLKQLLEGPGNGMNDLYWTLWEPLLKKYTHDR